MTIRVLRVIEYTFDDAEAMTRNLSRFVGNLNVSGMTMRSAVLAPEMVHDVPSEGWWFEERDEG